MRNSPNGKDDGISPDKSKLNADTVNQQRQQMFSRAQNVTGNFEKIDRDPNEYGTTGIADLLSMGFLQFGQQYRQNPTQIDPPSANANDLPKGTVPIESVTRENDEPKMDWGKQQRNTTHGDITSDKVAKQIGDTYTVRNVQTGQQCKSRYERPLPEKKKKCFASLQIQRMDNSNAHCPTEKYEFFTMDEHQHQMTSVHFETAELCNPSVGQMAETILSKHFGMKTIEQLLTQFDLKIQIRDRGFEPETLFVDLAQEKWRTEPIEHRGSYKVLLYPKMDERNYGGFESRGMNLKKGVGGERRQYDQQEMMMIDPQSTRVHRQLDEDEFGWRTQAAAGHGREDEFSNQRIRRHYEEEFGQRANRGQRHHNEHVFDQQQFDSYNRQHVRNAFGQPKQTAGYGYDDGFSHQGYYGSRQQEQRGQSFGSSLSVGHSKWEQIDRFLLSGTSAPSAPLANLYDALTDNFVTSNDHEFMCKMSNRNNSYSMQSMLTLREKVFEIDKLDDLKECVQMLGMDQQLSVIGQLALLGDVCPLGQFVRKALSQIGRGDSFGIIKMVPKMTFSLKLENTKVRNSIMQQSFNNDFATHFVVSTCYGSIVAVIMTFNAQKAAGKMDISTAKNIVRKFIHGQKFSSSEKSLTTHLNNSTQCSVFVDPSFGKVGVDLNFTDGVNLFAKAIKNASHPIAFSLASLSAINNKSPCRAITSQMTDETQIDWFYGQVKSVNECDGQLRKVGQLLDEYSYALSDEELDTAQQFLKLIEEEKKLFFLLLKAFIVDLRKGKSKGQMEVMELQKAVDEYVKNCQCVLGHYEKMLGEKIELINGLKQKGVNFVGRITRQQLDAIFELTDSNSSILHFVLLMDPSGPPVQKQGDSGKFFCLCLGQLYNFSKRGKCTFVDLNVLRNVKADDGLPEEIRALEGYPNIGTRLVKMRGNKLLANNCVAEEERKSQFCVARIENLKQTEVGAVLPADQKDIEHCILPCPFCEGYGGKCQNTDNLWECDDCGQTLTFVKRDNKPITHFYCACGKTPADGLTFRCADVNTHGNEFKHFGSEASLNKELDRLNTKGVLTFLLLGETGVGKSTLINALIAYLKHTTFEEALQAKEIESVIPARFCTDGFDSKGNWKKIEVVLGEQSEDERLKPGESQTKWPKAYVVPSKEGHKVRIIDAPGICDTDGVNEDNINFDKTLNFISTLPELHAVCILMRPNSPKLTLALKYCIDGLLTYLHKNATENIVFLFTNARGSNYKMGKTGELLEKVLPPIEQAHHVSIPLQRKRIYCLDNEAYEALCLIKKADIKYDQDELDNFSRSWSQAEREFQRLFQHVSTLEPHRTWETVSVNEARRTIIDLSEPLALITEEIQPCCTDVQRTLTGDVKLFMKHCHEHCYLENITPELFPNEGLKYCWAMNGTNTCTQCGCDWSVHMHYHYEQRKKTLTLDELKQTSLASQRADLSDLENVRLQMLRERETIYLKAALFCAFLKKWALKPYNDSMEAYINMSIKLAEKVVASCSGSEDQKRQEDKLEGLRESLRLYREQKDIIDNASAEDANGPKVITAEDVKKFFDDLCELPIFGKNIRQMFETKQKSRHEHQKEYSEKTTGVGLKLKPTRSGKVVQTGPYLNEEQRKLLKDYEKKQKEVEQLEQKMDRMNMLQLPTGNTSAHRQPQSSSSIWQQLPGFNLFFGRSSSAQNAPSSSNSVPTQPYTNNGTNLSPNFSSDSGWDSVTHTYKKQQN